MYIAFVGIMSMYCALSLPGPINILHPQHFLQNMLTSDMQFVVQASDTLRLCE